MTSLFRKASKKPKRLKMLIFGHSGVGKTVTSLNFPKPVVIDTEKGTDFYGEHFDFDVLQATKIEQVHNGIDEIINNSSNYKTLIIDSITVVDDMMSDDYLSYLRTKKGDSRYVFQSLDYRYLKSRMRNMIFKLLAVDLNIICTARGKPIYSEAEGNFMKEIGTTADVRKEVPYYFDVVLELIIDEEGNRIANVKKDRTRKLPTVFNFSYDILASYVGINNLERDADKTYTESELDSVRSRNTEILFEGKKINTAGVGAGTLLNLKNYFNKNPKLLEKLRNEYNVDSFLDLTEDEAQLFITDIGEEYETDF